MRKYLLITLINGQTFERDIPPMVSVPLGAPPSDKAYLLLCVQIVQQGFCENGDAKQPVWIAPSQIRNVKVIFESTLTVQP